MIMISLRLYSYFNNREVLNEISCEEDGSLVLYERNKDTRLFGVEVGDHSTTEEPGSRSNNILHSDHI